MTRGEGVDVPCVRESESLYVTWLCAFPFLEDMGAHIRVEGLKSAPESISGHASFQLARTGRMWRCYVQLGLQDEPQDLDTTLSTQSHLSTVW